MNRAVVDLIAQVISSSSRPGGVTTAAWDQYRTDLTVFRDRWLRDALAMGWTVHDLFAFDPRLGFDDPSQGLIARLQGRRLTRMTMTAATMTCDRGLRETRPRGKSDDAPLIWDVLASPSSYADDGRGIDLSGVRLRGERWQHEPLLVPRRLFGVFRPYEDRR